MIHFQDRWLRETNVINPQWITEAIYSLINAPQLVGGKLHRDHLTQILNNDIYSTRKHDYIIELMKKFELCYALNEHEFLLPDLFPTDEPDFDFDDSQALHILTTTFCPIRFLPDSWSECTAIFNKILTGVMAVYCIMPITTAAL